MELNGKIIDFLGDSITEGVGVTNREVNRYDNRLKAKYGLKATYNYGVGGTRLAHQQKPSAKYRHDLCFCGRAYDLNKDAEIIVVYGGVNDYLHGDAEFGELTDATPATFCGAVRSLIRIIKELYPGKTLVFMTPAHCYYQGVSDRDISKNTNKKPDAKPLCEYVKVIKTVCADMGVPALDLQEKLGLDPNNKEDYDRYTVDGLHFNDAGHEFIANALGEFLVSL
jgi:lysophospholipase L1-like esterase